MAAQDQHRIIAVLRDGPTAERAAERMRALNVSPRIGAQVDEIASLRGEMHQEVTKSFIGPGNVGPFTREQTWAVTVGSMVSIVIGALVALPLALIPIGWPLWVRLLVFGGIGAFAGWTVGFTMSGGRSLPSDHQMASERGVVVAADVADPDTADRVSAMLVEFDPIRVDRIDLDGGIETLSTEESIARDRKQAERDNEKHRRGA